MGVAERYRVQQPNCVVCGRFTRWDADCSVPFGGSEDLEPPPDEFYCARCAKREEDYYVAQGWVPNDWLKAAWQSRAAERLGLVAVPGGKGAAWTQWEKAA